MEVAPECSDWVPGQDGLLPGPATKSLQPVEISVATLTAADHCDLPTQHEPSTLAEQAHIPRGHTLYLHDTTTLELMVPSRTNLEHDTKTSLLCGDSPSRPDNRYARTTWQSTGAALANLKNHHIKITQKAMERGQGFRRKEWRGRMDFRHQASWLTRLLCVVVRITHCACGLEA